MVDHAQRMGALGIESWDWEPKELNGPVLSI